MKIFFIRIEEAIANYCGAMEADPISKNEASPKSHMSRGNITKSKSK